jgi:ATP-dependent protease ClpP protease subunit
VNANKFTVLATVLPVLILAFVLMSGRIDINLQHNAHLPPELTNKNYIYESGFSLFGKTYDIYMQNEIMKEHVFNDVLRVLDKASSRDSINFYIAGDGGNWDYTISIINHVKNTKAFVTMIVTRPSFSGHAFLAVSGNKLVMHPYTYLMFHTISGYGYPCDKTPGLDRTRPASLACKVVLNAYIKEINTYIQDIKILSDKEKKQVQEGYTIVVNWEQYYKRTGAIN